MYFRCYINSVGGGTECEGPRPFATKYDALDFAYDMAIGDYSGFEGLHGIPSYEDVRNCPEDYGLDENPSEVAILDAYEQERENYLDYWVEEAKDENDIDEDY